MKEHESNKKAFAEDKARIVQILIEKGDDCRIHGRDFDKVVIVKKKKSTVRERSQVGSK